MKKNVAVRVLCLIIAGVVLGSAVTVAAFMGSPYEILKKAVLDAITYRNATVQGQMIISVDGRKVDEIKLYYVEGDDAFLNYDFDRNGDIVGYRYSTKGLNISGGYFAVVNFPWHSANVFSTDRYWYERGNFSLLSPDERNSHRIQFMELLLDTLVGDLKNNITMSSEDDIRLISGTLTESQVPELAKAGIDLLAESSGIRLVQGKSLAINYVHGEAKVDTDGNLLSINANARATATDILGNRRVIEVKATINFSDIGTSYPLCPIPGARQLLTPEYLKNRFGSESVMVHFTQNEDGSINEESITTAYPKGSGHYEIKEFKDGFIQVWVKEEYEIKVEDGLISLQIKEEVDEGIDENIIDED
ncbi:MAG: hypothetical protein LBB91_12415 [Clostridiales bacterium]|jgi:hypothetical protein|nr:hypothetical protein [Clostridiales bacterium]